MGRRPRLLAGLTAAVAFAVAGCGDAEEVDATSVEDAVPSALLRDHPDLVTEVSCPGRIDRAAGTVTACTARIGETAVELAVTQLDDDGQVRVTLDRTLLDVEDLAARMAERLTADIGDPTSVRCDGPAVRVLVELEQLRCVATDTEDRPHSFLVTILDDAANFDLRLA